MYKLKADGGVVRLSDNANIPPSNLNKAWRDYQVWLAEGNTPDPEFTPEELLAASKAKRMADLERSASIMKKNRARLVDPETVAIDAAFVNITACTTPEDVETKYDDAKAVLFELGGIEGIIEVAPGMKMAQETFASKNVRFFGELGLPASQTGWSEDGTGPITLASDSVFGITKNVVKCFSTTGNVTRAKSPVTGADWDNILAFGASFSGITRITEDINTNSIFAGIGFSSVNDPRSSSIESRAGMFISVDATHTTLRLDGLATIILDGAGGRPLVLKDDWFKWEAVIKPTPDAGANFGAVDVFVNDVLVVTGAIIASNNAVSDEVSIANSSSSGQTTFYVDNFGVTIFEESATKTLASATMLADLLQVTVPEGKRDYTIILPDGSPRGVGAIFDITANNVSGKVTLTNQDVTLPEVLYNGLRTLVLDIVAKNTLRGINTVANSNVYIGF